MCPAKRDMVPHYEAWEILSIDGMIFISICIAGVFVILFGSCQIVHYVHKKDVLGLEVPVCMCSQSQMHESFYELGLQLYDGISMDHENSWYEALFYFTQNMVARIGNSVMSACVWLIGTIC